MRIFFRGLLYHAEQARFFLLAVNDKLASENLVTAVLGVYLCKTEHLTVGKRSAELLLHAVQIFHFGRRQSEPLTFVIFFKILNMLYWLRLMIHGEYRLVEPFIHALQHRVVLGILVCHGEKFLYTHNAVEIHVLCNLNGIGAPRCNHLASRTDEEPFNRCLDITIGRE